MKKLFATLLALVMVLCLSVTAFAQNVGTAAENTAAITIENAAKGETYTVYKLFDATVTGATNGSIAYTGEIPDSLSTYFTKDAAGNISAVADIDEEALFAALADWTKTATAAATTVSDGSALNFAGLDYGYYVVTTTQGSTAITVTSTNPNATIVDKNNTTPAPGTEGLKRVDDENVSIGDTVTYTVHFTTSNYYGAGEAAKKVASYTIADTLPAFLSDVTVTGITIKQTGENDIDYKVGGTTPQFTEKAITIPWVDAAKTTSLYQNGAEIVVTYTAVVNDAIFVGGAADANKNVVTIRCTDVDGVNTTLLTDDETVSTYAAAIQKIDENGDDLAGAKFRIKGLVAEGSKGNYTVVSYDPSPASTVTGTELEADDSGLIVINGIASDETLVATETVAPDGYNELTSAVNVTPVQTSEVITTTTTTTTTYYDADGNVTDVDSAVTEETVTTITGADAVTPVEIENRTGAMLPTTGGAGTTALYVVGAILALGAGVLLITKKRMNSRK